MTRAGLLARQRAVEIERLTARIAELEAQLELAISKVPFPEQQCPGAVATLTNNTVQSKEGE